MKTQAEAACGGDAAHSPSGSQQEASGVYLARFTAGDFTSAKKVMVVR